ncbi:class I SAM-dependent methyltransferase [Actinacidiphila oryziradicis]|uniref:SAM-dependent methyltransferase n=1 Tax=Actinacidiphila oryziradicis TaxID=2571141 RepID=A0A4U0SW61_9ACTN|nr:class I SAM-dependent methyltransferase [Actinacidiphila oryziradicis]MCW2873412.1 methyltransferase [Actinacidiphila oryziradicis]TKA12911.1 SAM-dependent methyltransferase [Actinacidiphila oryziradicis]
MDLEAFSALLTGQGQALLAGLRDYDPAQELGTATRLRREHPAALVSAALAQARLRQRGAAKFGEDAYRMYFTPDGVEQATRTSVAAHRAARFTALGVRRVADLCGGIGGDAIALARAGVKVLAVDRSPLTCAVANANARALGLEGLIEVRCADVTEVDTGAYDAVFVDPARRGGRGRIFDPEAYSPPLSWAVAAARKAPYAALKIAPGIPHEAVPEEAEAEWVSDRGDVKEAVLWFGTAPGARRATLLPSGASLVGEGLQDPAARPVGRYLYEPDGAVIRAHLVADIARTLGGGLIDETIAYITADELRPTPYATPYEITDVLPFNLKRLKALLRERRVGTAVIKKRGSAVEPEELRKRLRLEGVNTCVIVLTRVAGAPMMLLGNPAQA